MKKTIVGLLAIASLCSFTTKKKKPEPPFKKGDVTLIAGAGYPPIYNFHTGTSVGPLNVGADYQASRRWSFGLQYSFQYATTGIETFAINNTSGGIVTSVYSFQYQQNAMYHTLMATADICYLNKGRVCLNSGIAIGYTLRPITSARFMDNIDHSGQLDSAPYLPVAFRLRLVNARVKITENFGAYGGISYGVDGFLLVGASYTLAGRK